MTAEGIAKFLKDFPIPGKATFFAHDNFPILYSSAHEICPHPVIEDLSTWEEEVRKRAAYLPIKPRGVRPHSCVFSHVIGVGLKALGYTYVSQAQNLFQRDLKPFRHPWGIWELPIYYMDNMDFWMAKNWPPTGHYPFNREVIEQSLSDDSLYVFDIHPLHVALNTRSHEDYPLVKEKIVNHGVSPFELSFPGRGARAFYLDLCEAMQNRGIRSRSCFEALEQFGCL